MPWERISWSLVLMNDKYVRHKAEVHQLPFHVAVFLNAAFPCLALHNIKQLAENGCCFIENVNYLSRGLGEGSVFLRGSTKEFSEWSRAEGASPLTPSWLFPFFSSFKLHKLQMKNI